MDRDIYRGTYKRGMDRDNPYTEKMRAMMRHNKDNNKDKHETDKGHGKENEKENTTNKRC